MMSLAQTDSPGIGGCRAEGETASGVSARAVSIVILLMALQLVLNAVFRNEGERAAPHVAMLALMGVAGWNALRWHFVRREAGSVPTLHYVMLALGAYVAIDAYCLSIGDGKTEAIDVARFAFWMIGYFFFYAAARSHAVGERHVTGLLICAVPMVLLVLRQDAVADEMDRQGLGYSATSTGYVCLSLIPWALLLKRSFLKNAALVLCAIGVILSLKRGAVFALFVAGVITPVLCLRARDWLSFRRLAVAATLLLALACAAHARSDAVKYRLGKGSGDRQSLWDCYIGEFARSNAGEWCFGHGAVATKRVCVLRAHCDWIEMGFNYGLIGLFLFAAVFVLLVIGCARSFTSREPAAAAFCFSLIAFSLASLYSGMLSTPMLLMYSSIFGLAHGRCEKSPERAGRGTAVQPPSSVFWSPAQAGPPSAHCVPRAEMEPSPTRKEA
jgi:hypothetical protein